MNYAKLAGGEAFTNEAEPQALDEPQDAADMFDKLEANVKANKDQAPAKKGPGKRSPAKKAPAKKAAKKAAAKKS